MLPLAATTENGGGGGGEAEETTSHYSGVGKYINEIHGRDGEEKTDRLRNPS